MIRINNLNKKYDERVILKNINVDFPKKGLVFIGGRSGEGKTTLLNVLSMLDDEYRGEIFIDEISYSEIKNKDEFRHNHFAYILQDYPLFESLSINDNIEFGKDINYKKQQRINDVLKFVDLNVDINQSAGLLSGGEKQRLAIARSLYSSPEVLFCDEITASLDMNNKHIVMDLLRKVANDILVIVVSHEEEIMNKYADYVYELKEGSLINKLTLKNQTNTSLDMELINKDNKFDNKKINTYIKTISSKNKSRVFFSSFALAIGLFCIGISSSISSIVSRCIETSLISEFDENKLVVKQKEKDESFNEVYSAPEGVVIDMKDKYQQYVQHMGTYYFSDFETQLPDSYFLLTSGNYDIPFYELNTRSINEFEVTTDYQKEEFYGIDHSDYKNGEICLKLREKDVIRVCKNEGIDQHTVSALDAYLKNNYLTFTFVCSNEEWNYYTEIFFYCDSFIIGDELGIIHSDPRFNETIFENYLRFETTDDLISTYKVPWTFKKVFYLRTYGDNQLILLNMLWRDDEYLTYGFNFIDSSNSVYLSSKGKTGRIYITINDSKRMSLNKIDENLLDNVNKVYCNNSSYYLIDNLLTNTFLNSTFLLSDEKDAISIIDENYITEENISYTPLFSNGNHIYGGLGSSMEETSLRFDNEKNIKKLYGRLSNNYQEIVISKNIASKLFPFVDYQDIINNHIYFLTIKNTIYDDGNYINDFVYCPLQIVGIDLNENEYNVIFGDELWTSFFYIDNFEYSPSDVYPSKCLISLNDLNKKEVINSFSKINNDYVIEDPLENIISSVNDVIFYIDIGLYSIAGIVILCSIFMSIVVVYQFHAENKKDIKLYRILGISRLSIMKLFSSYLFNITRKGFLFSIFSFLLTFIFLIFEYNLVIDLDLIKVSVISMSIMLITSLLLWLILSIFSIRNDVTKKKINLEIV